MRNVEFAAGNFDFILVSFVVSQRAESPLASSRSSFAGKRIEPKRPALISVVLQPLRLPFTN
jgi:hypothetical protein